MSNKLLKLLLVLLFISLSSCKSEDGKLDLLIGGGGGSSLVEELEITNSSPEDTNVTIEIGESKTFLISALAPIPNVVTYSWTLNGSPIAAVNSYIITGQLSNVGYYTLIATASDGETAKQRTWIVKINGPPVLSDTTTGPLAVSFESNINLSISASDPNNDIITYRWLLNGSTSSYVSGTSSTGNLSGDISLIGANTVTVEVSDATKTTSYTWNVEVNYFPQACNQLTTGQICTYAGGAHKGNGLNASNTTYPLRFRPFSHVQDSLGNFFISDLDNNVVWYWNKTASPISRVGQNIAAGVIQIVAGTGEDATGSAGISAITSPLNSPRGLWYDDLNDKLYVAEYDGNQVKYIDSSGTVFVGLGGGTSHVDGNTAFNHDCNAPVHLSHYSGSLYVACYSHHRVKRWDLASDLAYVAVGDGGNDIDGEDAVPNASGIGQPYGVYVDASGIYVSLYNLDYIRYVNTTGVAKTFWSATTPIVVNPGRISTIMGSGAGGTGGVLAAGNPLATAVAEPASIVVRNGNEIYVAGHASDELIVGNNSVLPLTIDGVTIPAGQIGRFNSATNNSYNGSNSSINNTRINDTFAISIDQLDNNKLVFSDSLNYRLRDTDLSNGSVHDILGSGKGKNGFYGDILLASFQHLYDYPSGLAFDNNSKTLFFSDQNNHRIRQVDRYGQSSTAVGRGNGDPISENDFPSNVLIRSNYDTGGTAYTRNNGFDIWNDGSLLQLNSYGHNVRIWNRSGSDQTYLSQFVQNDRVVSVAGDWIAGIGATNGPALSSKLNYPNSVKFYNNAGNMEIFIADTMNHCIRHVDSAGNMTTVLGLCGTAGAPGLNVTEAASRFNRPRGIAVAANGNLFISDYNNSFIWYWNRTASPVSIGTITINPNMVAVVSCLGGTTGSTGENVLTSSARCIEPSGIALSGNTLCYAQRVRNNVRCFNTTTGIVKTVAGRIESIPTGGSTFDFAQEGIAGTAATLLNPAGVAFDANGDLYISDTYNHVIRKVKLSP